VNLIEKELRDAGIRAQPNLAIDFSKTHRRYVLCADECGGAAPTIGHYVGFIALRDDPTFFINPTVGPANTSHARVAASTLISVEMFREEKTYQLCAHLHWLVRTKRKDGRPSHRQHRLFFGNSGVLNNELWLEDKTNQVGAYTPTFYSRAGDPLIIPAPLVEVVGAITDAVCCVNCRKSHILALSQIALPDEWRAAMAPKPLVKRSALVSAPAVVALPSPTESAEPTVVETKPVAEIVPTPEMDEKARRARRNKKNNDRRKRNKRLARQKTLALAASATVALVTQPEVSQVDKARASKTIRNKRNNARRKRKKLFDRQQKAAAQSAPVAVDSEVKAPATSTEATVTTEVVNVKVDTSIKPDRTVTNAKPKPVVKKPVKVKVPKALAAAAGAKVTEPSKPSKVDKL
jgi:hypothetical protein